MNVILKVLVLQALIGERCLLHLDPGLRKVSLRPPWSLDFGDLGYKFETDALIEGHGGSSGDCMGLIQGGIGS